MVSQTPSSSATLKSETSHLCSCLQPGLVPMTADVWGRPWPKGWKKQRRPLSPIPARPLPSLCPHDFPWCKLAQATFACPRASLSHP